MMDDLRSFDFFFWLTIYLMPYWGIFMFRLRVIDLHRATWSLPLTGCTPRRGRVHYFIMIPQWSLSWAIQSNPYFSSFVCHHASYSRRHFLDIWVRFGLRRSHIWWWMISCHSIFVLPYIWCHTGAYSISGEIYESSWSRTIVSIYEIHTEAMTYLLSCHDSPMESLLSHSVRLTLFGI